MSNRAFWSLIGAVVLVIGVLVGFDIKRELERRPFCEAQGKEYSGRHQTCIVIDRPWNKGNR